jgi:CspA family cold shock protein
MRGCGSIELNKTKGLVSRISSNGFDYSINDRSMKGKIARLTDRGFGFITPDEGGDKDLFFHARSLVDGLQYDSLKEGDVVMYDVEEGDKGLAAVNVRLA